MSSATASEPVVPPTDVSPSGGPATDLSHVGTAGDVTVLPPDDGGGTPVPGEETAAEIAVSTGDAIIPLADFLSVSFGQLGILMAFFGTLLTAIVVFFSIRTKDAAVAEAKVAMAEIRAENVELRAGAEKAVNTAREKMLEARTDILTVKDSIKEQVAAELLAMRDEIKRLEFLMKEQMIATQKEQIQLQQDLINLKDNLKEAVDEAVARAKEIDTTLEKMKSGAFAEEILESLAANSALTEEEKLSVSLQSSAVVEQRDVSQFTRSDFLTLIAHHSAEENWDQVEELTTYMKENGKNDDIRALGYFYSGKTFFARKSNTNDGGQTYWEAAEGEYRAAIDQFAGSSHPEVRLTVAKCRNNLIVVYLREDGYEDAIKLAEEALNHLDGLKPDDMHRLKAKVLINQANALSHLGKNDEAIEVYEMVIRNLLQAPAFPGKEDRIGLAYYNMACAWALLKKIDPTVECLRKGHSHSRSALNDLLTDEDFDDVRNEKAFKTFLDEFGYRDGGGSLDFGDEN